MKRFGILVLTFLLVGHLPVAKANLILTAAGNPTGAPVAGDATRGFSVLDPNPASYQPAGLCPWIRPALAAQGFSAANGWTINALTLTGGIQLDTYLAWTQTEPAVDQGTGATRIQFAAEAKAGLGGADLGLGYKPNRDRTKGALDPSGNGVHWIQVVHTNQPSAFGKGNGVADPTPGVTDYIDDGYNYAFNRTGPPPKNPFYDSGYSANVDNFVDEPSRALFSGADWDAQVFIATWAPNNANDVTKGGTITLYDGVWWGFDLPAPEPASCTLLAIGVLSLGGFAWRQRRRVA